VTRALTSFTVRPCCALFVIEQRGEAERRNSVADD